MRGGLFGNAQPQPQAGGSNAFNFFGTTTTSNNTNKAALKSSPPDRPELAGVGSGSFRVPSSPPQPAHADMEHHRFGATAEDALHRDIEDGDMTGQTRSRGYTAFSQSAMSRNSVSGEPFAPTLVDINAKQTKYNLLDLAKSFSGISPRLQESDDIILGTERIMEKLHQSVVSGDRTKRVDVLSDVAHELMDLWETSNSQNMVAASRLAELLLSIHHPSRVAERDRSTALSLFRPRSENKYYTPIPRVLLDWLCKHHDTVSEVGLVLEEQNGYSASPHFWDAILASAIRGNFHDIIKLLSNANFTVAASAEEDGVEAYSGDQLYNTNVVVNEAIALIEECPAVASEDWDVKGADWKIWRERVLVALQDLTERAEGASHNRQSLAQSFSASHFGISQSQSTFRLSEASRRAESRIPWTIYENLSILYKQFLGNDEDVVAVAGDWIEAVVGLTVWWNGEEESIPQGSLAASRRSIGRSQRVRMVDVTPVKAYCQRLSASLAATFAEEGLEFNNTDRTELALACIFDDNVEGILHILRSWSPLVASAVAEVASTGEWFRHADGILDQFDQGDLMVLSYNEDRQTKSLTKDDLLIGYADLLADKDVLRSQDGKTVREGWELAVEALDRLDDEDMANARIEEILSSLELDSGGRVDKITQVCASMGLAQHAQRIALTYADNLRTKSQNYGDTLLYYARAHEPKKIQEVLQVLVSHCLVQSAAYPPLASLDASLKSLITSPKQTLTKLALVDSEGAQLLSNYLSGYATIRKYYDLRDEELLAGPGQKPAHRPMMRKRVAANALMVIISSAASSIRGGLYDPEVETVVQVDVLLPLLGEALVFLNQNKRTLTLQHLYALLAAVEDFDTAPSMIRSQCESVLSTTLAAAHENQTSPSRSQHKSTTSSQFSLIGSQDFGSFDTAGGRSTESSAFLVGDGKGKGEEVKRAWDWRKGFPKEATGSDVVRVLRMGIAREMARAVVEN